MFMLRGIEGSTRHVDIVAINGASQALLILDPTMRFDRNNLEQGKFSLLQKKFFEECEVPSWSWTVVRLQTENPERNNPNYCGFLKDCGSITMYKARHSADNNFIFIILV